MGEFSPEDDTLVRSKHQLSEVPESKALAPIIAIKFISHPQLFYRDFVYIIAAMCGKVKLKCKKIYAVKCTLVRNLFFS